MKNMIIATLAIVGLSACSHNSPKTADHRSPSGFGIPGSLEKSSDASIDFSGSVIHTSVNVSKAAFQGSKKVSQGLADILSATPGAIKDIAIVGWGVSRDSSAVVITSANEASTALSKAVAGSTRFVVTTSGQIIEASVDISRDAIEVSVDLAKDSSEAIVRVGGYVVGSVKVSAIAVKDAALWTSGKVGAASAWSLDKSGKLIHKSIDLSGKVLGPVFDASGKAIAFVVDQSGNLLTISKDVSVAVFHGSVGAFKGIVAGVKGGLKGSANFISGTIEFSAEKTLIVIKWSANGVEKVSKFISNSVHDIIQSTPEVRGSSAAAAGSTSSN